MKKILQTKAVRIGLEALEIYLTRRASRSAAQLAYFLILSLCPFLIVLYALIGILNLDITAFLEGAAAIFPGASLGILNDYLSYIAGNHSHGLLWIGVVMMLFSGASAFQALVHIMEEIYECKDNGGIRQIITRLIYSILFLVAIYLSLAVLLTGNWLFQRLESTLTMPSVNLPWSWQWLRFVILFFLMLLFVLLAYRLAAPKVKGQRTPILLGAFISSLALVIFSGLFSWFIGLSSRYSLVYGSLASVIILLIWLYLCGNILISGCIVNYILYRHKKMSDAA
ncbi:MAG: YihY/virulence factor BrkB family protein [Oscillospiraceae bacterium]|nr:YihY/virulence factor BrkB family protein [Oscillospiraceae bacterium]